MSKRVLVVEDNVSLVSNLFAFLEPRGFTLDAAQDGIAGLQLARDGNYDVVILDWGLPRLDGRMLLGKLRESGCGVPVIMLTSRDELPDKIAGFKAGADDYLVKPFELAELEVRLDALMVRDKGRSTHLLVGDLKFDLASQVVTRAGVALQLHSGGRKLLEALMRASPALVERQQLESLIWGDDIPDGDMLRSHIYELRRAVDGPFASKLIHTIPKRGYRIADSDPG